jgi:serine/threonine protein kinase
MSGATYLHALGVVHGDLKGVSSNIPDPLFALLTTLQANILVDDNGAARIADFGLMRIAIDLSTIPLSATTVSSAGTVCWMSPELLFVQNSLPTLESDCYALGMVIYEVGQLHSSQWPSVYPPPGLDRPPTVSSPQPLRGSSCRTERRASQETAQCRVPGFL